MKIIKPSVKLCWITSSAMNIIESSGRVCYNSENNITSNSADSFVRNLIKRGHLSVLEHASVSYEIICDRAIANELVRHRLASFSQLSTRYCNFSKDKFGNEISIIQPLDLSEEEYEHWYECCQKCEDTYMNLVLVYKVKPEIARSVLPLCLATKIIFTCNFRELRHILEERYYNKKAHPQIREIMDLVRNSFKCFYPIIIEDLEEKYNEEKHDD